MTRNEMHRMQLPCSAKNFLPIMSSLESLSTLLYIYIFDGFCFRFYGCFPCKNIYSIAGVPIEQFQQNKRFIINSRA